MRRVEVRAELRAAVRAVPRRAEVVLLVLRRAEGLTERLREVTVVCRLLRAVLVLRPVNVLALLCIFFGNKT